MWGKINCKSRSLGFDTAPQKAWRLLNRRSLQRPEQLRNKNETVVIGSSLWRIPVEYSERYEQALRLAARLHRSQTRKGSDLPYITHPVHVSVILLRHGFSTEVAIAGLLHDVVEDQEYALGPIKEQFGAQVAEIVAALSECKEDAQGAKRPWETRKREALEHMRQASLEAVAVKVADALHNAQCFVLDLRREGPTLWKHFNRGPEAQWDYYRKLLQIARERLENHPLVDELTDAVQALVQAIDKTGRDRKRTLIK
jgi:(p)ppGpp synthase/HD superfamily hydrolase